MSTTTKANIGAILGTALFGVANDLVEAKENGQQLPGFLDKIASVVKGAKDAGVDLVKEEAKEQSKKMIPWAIAAVCIGIVIYVLLKNKS